MLSISLRNKFSQTFSNQTNQLVRCLLVLRCQINQIVCKVVDLEFTKTFLEGFGNFSMIQGHILGFDLRHYFFSLFLLWFEILDDSIEYSPQKCIFDDRFELLKFVLCLWYQNLLAYFLLDTLLEFKIFNIIEVSVA